VRFQSEGDEEYEDALHQHTQQSLAEVIFAHKHILLEIFRELDVRDGKTEGKVKAGQWCEVMERVLTLHLDWEKLQPVLAPTDAAGDIRYLSFLNQYKLQMADGDKGATGAVSQDALQTLYRNHKQLAAVFRFLDKDMNGAIDKEEFSSGITLLNRKLGAEGQIENIDEMFQLMDLDKDGQIDMNEFCECFRITQA